MRRAWSLGLVAFLLSAPAMASEPAPKGNPEAGPVKTVDYVPVGIAGLSTFGASWIATIVLGATTNSGNKKLAAGHAIVPVGGPFIMLAERSNADGLEGALAGLGVLQGLGLGAGLLGFTLESKVSIGEAATITPYVLPSGAGISGAF